MSSYATTTDLDNCGLPASALSSIDSAVKQVALDDHSAEADGYIGDKVTLPLTAPYDRTLVRMICFRAAWDLLCFRGYNPSDPSDAVVERRALMAEEWFKRVANGQIRLNVTQAAPESLQPDVYTAEPRGFGDQGMGGTNDPAVGASGGWGD